MRWDKKKLLLLGAILVVAFGLRLGAGVWWQHQLPEGQRFGFGDSESYWVLAQTIVHGRTYEYGDGMRVFRTPGYPVLLAGLFTLVGDDPPVMWARGLGAVLGTLAVGAIFWLAYELFNITAAYVAAGLAALYPGAISMSTFVLSEAPFCPLMLAQLVCWCLAIRRSSTKASVGWAVTGGIAAALATLVRPSWLPFTALVALLAVVVCDDRRRQASIGLAMTATLVLTLLPWWIRNYEVTGEFVPTTLQVGASLYDGLNPHATGSSDMRFVSRFVQEQRQADAEHHGALTSTFEYRLDRRMRDAAITWTRTHLGRAIQLAGIKVVRIWAPLPNAPNMQSWNYRLTMLVGYTPLILLAIGGAAMFPRREWRYGLCLLPALYFTALHSIFVSSIRYREPAMLPLIVLASGFLCYLFGYRSE